MKLISNVKAAWTHYSTIALGIAASIQGTWAALPEFIKSGLPEVFEQGVSWVTFAVAILGMIGKFIDQTPKELS